MVQKQFSSDKKSSVGQERVLVVRDAEGHYSTIPVKHLEEGRVQPEFIKNLQSILAEQQATQPAPQILGVYSLSRSIRRAWASPTIESVGVTRAAPTS